MENIEIHLWPREIFYSHLIIMGIWYMYFIVIFPLLLCYRQSERQSDKRRSADEQATS
jgi:hypothetical protein